MNDVFVWYIRLPDTIRGVTTEDENGDYNIYINAALSSDQQKLTLKHEMAHIRRNDFASEESIFVIEDLEP